VKWDDDYDGTWDAPYATLAPRDVTRDAPGIYAYKAHVRNAGGRVAEAVTYVTFTPAGGGDGNGGGGGCGCRTTGDGNDGGTRAAFVALGALGMFTMLARRRRR
jgi:MYXO-CTERM domain-containing protein